MQKQNFKNGYGAPTANAPPCAWKNKGAKQDALHRKQKKWKTMQRGCLLRLPRKKSIRNTPQQKLLAAPRTTQSGGWETKAKTIKTEAKTKIKVERRQTDDCGLETKD